MLSRAGQTQFQTLLRIRFLQQACLVPSTLSSSSREPPSRPPTSHRHLQLILPSGGLELLFSNQRDHKIALPSKDTSGNPVNVAYLIHHLCEKVMGKNQKKELFVLDESV